MQSTTRQSPSSSPWSAIHHSRQLSDYMNTSTNLTLQSSAFNGNMPSPFLFPRDSSDGGGSGGSAPSPNYFGLPVENYGKPPASSPGSHTKKNWDAYSQAYSSLPSPKNARVSPNPAQKQIFNLVGSSSRASQEDVSHNTQHHNAGVPALNLPEFQAPRQPASAGKPGLSKGTSERYVNQMDIDEHTSPMQTSPMQTSPMETLQRGRSFNSVMSFDFPKSYSPSTYPQNRDSQDDDHSHDTRGNINLSLPAENTRTSIPNSSPEDRPRAGTLPTPLDQVPITFITAEVCDELLQTASETTLLLDIRPYPQFSQANIMDSLNLCIPTTLLKRPSFNTDKLLDTFGTDEDKRKFLSWRQSTYIIVYDSNTEQPRDATLLMNVLKKFRAEGWRGEGRILRGGFAAYASRFPNRIRQQRQSKAKPSGMQTRPMSLKLPSTVPVAGGCAIPEAGGSEPFFSNIRQNMDLVGGVGQMPVSLPKALTTARHGKLPQWLRNASAHEDEGKDVSQKFLKIEQRELHRMREALDSQANYNENTSSKFRVAGIEKGSKNRYNDIYPFDHSRVRLQDIPSGDCDYINANHVKAEHTNKSYIATQAPVPDTFKDFWRVVWEHDVRVIVALTAEVERGQIKCHPYWNNGSYGPFKVKSLGERRVYMDSTGSEAGKGSAQEARTQQRPSMPERKESSDAFYNTGDDRPYVLVRHFTLSHSAHPFMPIREITQLQYSHWPDFGTTSQPSHLLKLIEQCNKIARRSSGLNLTIEDADPPGVRPILVHCSAGCGRTGTFCTVDSVLDILKQQRAKRIHGNQRGATREDDRWAFDDTVDLVAKTVEDFRTQRPSMVQNLSQFVLCYETILEWAVARFDDK